MRLKIKKNKHYSFPRFFTTLPKWVSGKKTTKMLRSYMFTESCLFDLHDEDQHDVNKLFGFSIGWHHKTSFRFGWRPNLENRTIEIVGYEYHDGVRQPTMTIGFVKLNQWYNFKLTYNPISPLVPEQNFLQPIVAIQRSFYEVRTTNETPVWLSSFSHRDNRFNLKKKCGLGYTLGIYFGGNEKAPQNITIMKK